MSPSSPSALCDVMKWMSVCVEGVFVTAKETIEQYACPCECKKKQKTISLYRSTRLFGWKFGLTCYDSHKLGLKHSILRYY